MQMTDIDFPPVKQMIDNVLIILNQIITEFSSGGLDYDYIETFLNST